MSARKSVTKRTAARRSCNFHRKTRRLKAGSAKARKFMTTCVEKILARKPAKRRKRKATSRRR